MCSCARSSRSRAGVADRGAHEPARAGRRVCRAGRVDRRHPPGRESVPGAARRGRDREDGAAEAPGRVGVGRDGRAGGRASSPRWSWRSRACISCAGRCSIGSRGFRRRSARRSRSCSALRAGAAPDRFLVGLAVLSLFSEVADERPLLCVVDDAQWLDQASALTLAFVARRLLAEPVGIVFAAREPGEELQHLSELEVHGLRDGDARALLSSAVRFTLDAQVRDRIIAETRGNPLALLELPRGLTATQLAGGFGLLGAPALTRADRGELRPATRDAPRRGAAPGAGRGGGAGRRSAAALARGRAARDPPGGRGSGRGARAAGGRRARDVPSPAGTLRRLPIGAGAGTGSVHRALAEATDRDLDPDRRAWHLAAAAAGPDEQVAVELERSAARAQARGGLAAAAAFLKRAVALTDDSRATRGRALAAAQASLQAGAFDAALELLVTAESRAARRAPARPGGPAARPDRVRPQPATRSRSCSAAPAARAARCALARETYLDALSAAMFVGGPMPAHRRGGLCRSACRGAGRRAPWTRCSTASRRSSRPATRPERRG